MTLLKSTDRPALTFSPRGEGQKFRTSSNKIAWLHTQADRPGASFDIIIKDAFGRVKLQKLNCKSETDKYGEMVNFPTLIGEDLEVSVANIKGAEKVSLFLN